MTDKPGFPDLDGQKEDFFANNARNYPKKQYVKMKYETKDEWEAKYYRESWSFAFGSIMGAYGQINQGKDLTTIDILAFSTSAYLKAEELVKNSIEKTK